MKKLNLALTAMLFCAAVVILTACKAGDQAGSGRVTNTAQGNVQQQQGATANSQQQQASASVPDDGVARITVEEAQKAVEEGKAVIVDVRAPTEYERSHIKGALSLPRGVIKERAGELPKDKLIITYCA